MTTVVSMRFASSKSEEELRQLSEFSLDKFRGLHGLSQKYYVQNKETGLVGGIYIFHTRQAAEDYVNGPIVATLPERFAVEGDLLVELLDVDMSLSE